MDNHIADLRHQSRVSQAELGRAVGVSRQTITSVERGASVPQLTLAYKIARYFGRQIEEVFDLRPLDDELPPRTVARQRV